MIFHYFTQNESEILKWNLVFRRETTETLTCCTIAEILVDGFLEVHPIHRNLCSTQLLRVGNNIDSRDNRFVYGSVTPSL